MKLSEILRAKGRGVHTISPRATLMEVVTTLVHHNCGSLLVCEEASARLLGIITERDILRALAQGCEAIEVARVQDVMSQELIVGSPNDSLEDVMGLMTNHRIRHLPIVENDRLMGIISIGDVVKYQHDNLTLENHYLKTYIHGD